MRGAGRDFQKPQERPWPWGTNRIGKVVGQRASEGLLGRAGWLGIEAGASAEGRGASAGEENAWEEGGAGALG